MEPQPTSSSWATCIGSGLCGLLVAYAVGIGPATYVYERSSALRPALSALYAPARALAGTPLERPIFRYVTWWEKLARRTDVAAP